MPDLLSTGVTWLAGKLQTGVSQSVTYLRGSQAVGSGLTATLGRTEKQQDEQTGILLWVQQDFIVTAADLTLDGSVIVPRNGDKITVTATGKTYELLGDDGLPCYSPMDGMETMLRLRTKKVDE